MSGSGSVGDVSIPSHFCPNCQCLVFPVNDLTCPLCDGDLEAAALQGPNPNLSRLPETRVLGFLSRFLHDDDVPELHPAVPSNLRFVRDFTETSVVTDGSLQLTVLLGEFLLVDENNLFHSLPAAPSVVAALPEIMISEGVASTDEALCIVCRDVFVAGGKATQMPCGHFYHRDCILPWLALHNTCPVCRKELPTEDLIPGDVGGRNATDEGNAGAGADGGNAGAGADGGNAGSGADGGNAGFGADGESGSGGRADN